MSLINEQQKKNAGVDKSPIKIPVPKPQQPTESAPAAPATPAIEPESESFEPIEQAPIEFFEQPLAEAKAAEVEQPQQTGAPFNLAETVRPGSSTEQRVPSLEPTEAVTPYTPKANLWQDVTEQQPEGFQINLPNDVQTKRPTLFAPFQEPSNVAGAQANQLFTDASNSYLDRKVAAENARISRANEFAANNPRTLKNTPDISKPWHETAWDGITGAGGYFHDVLFGSQEAQDRTKKENEDAEFKPHLGLFGRHGAGAGGLLKYTLSVPLSLVPFAYEEVSESLVIAQKTLLENANAPYLYKGKYVSFNEIPEADRRAIALSQYNRTVGNIFPGYYSPKRRNTISEIGKILTGKKIGDDVNDANPALEPMKGAVPEPPKGGLFSYGRRPGQPYYTDRGTFWEVLNQVKSPANKIDVAGNAIGALVGKGFGTVGNLVFGKRIFIKQADEALEAARRAAESKVTRGVLQPGKGVEELTTRPGKAPQRLLPPAKENLSPLAVDIDVPAVKVTEVPDIDVPAVRVPDISETVARVNASSDPRAARPYIPQPKIEVEPGTVNVDPQINPPYIVPKTGVDDLPSVSAPAIEVSNPPFVVPQNFRLQAVVPDLVKAPEPVIPRASAIEALEQIGVMQPGRTIDMTPSVFPRNHDDMVAFMKTGTEQQQDIVRGYKGTSWDEWEAFNLKRNPERAGELNSVGSILDAFPNVTPSKLDDLIKQSTDLAATRNIFEQSQESLRRYFDEAVDLGRRPIDDLPVAGTNTTELLKTIESGGSVKLTPSAEATLPKEAVQALRENNVEAIEKLVTPAQLETAVETHNASLELTSRVTKYATRTRIKPPAQVIHGTAVKGWTPDYNIAEFGSRGELGAGLYTTVVKEEATNYARAVVGENVSANARYAELEPNINLLDTSGFQATLDASKRVPAQVMRDIRYVLSDIPIPEANYSFKKLMATVERGVGKVDPSEEGLLSANRRVSEVLRKNGYDSIYEKRSGWFVGLDNAKFKVKKQIPITAPKDAAEAANARFNVDSIAAKMFPQHVTSAANLADSNYKVLDQTRALVDDKLAEVQEKAIEKIANAEVPPTSRVTQKSKAKTVVANAAITKKAADVKKVIEQYGQPLTQPIVKEKGRGTWNVIAGAEIIEAAKEMKLDEIEVVMRSGKTDLIMPLKINNVDFTYAAKQIDVTPPKTVEEVAATLKKRDFLPMLPVIEKNSAGYYIPKEGSEAIVQYFIEKSGKIPALEADTAAVLVIDNGKVTKEVLTPDWGDEFLKVQPKKLEEVIEEVPVLPKKKKAPVKKKAKTDAPVEKQQPKDDFFDEDNIREPTDEEIMNATNFDDIEEFAQFNPEEYFDELLDSLDDGTICRY